MDLPQFLRYYSPLKNWNIKFISPCGDIVLVVGERERENEKFLYPHLYTQVASFNCALYFFFLKHRASTLRCDICDCISLVFGFSINKLFIYHCWRKTNIVEELLLSCAYIHFIHNTCALMYIDSLDERGDISSQLFNIWSFHL